ncbi:MAG TPA: AbrB/MazE/SpoVT family DNA-binding domain-containing protein [Chloroflexota bacterium]|nr:AbrB/MazE/SpoVT family DNA-binding domain-containing protein [Chloroflexota bacterium]
MASQVSERGQITIERSIREQLGIEPGMVAYQSVVDGRLEVVFLPAPHTNSLYGALKGQASGRAPRTRAEIGDAVMETLAEKHALLARAAKRGTRRTVRDS